MNQLRPITAIILKEWKARKGFEYLLKLFGDATRSAALAWIVYQSGNLELLAYICVGLPLLTIWSVLATLSGWSLQTELWGKTLDFNLISRTPMYIMLFSKIIAGLVFEIMGAVVSLATVLLVARAIPEVSNITFLIFSSFVAIIGLAVTGFFFTPFVVLSGSRAGFYMGVVPFFAVLSGLIVPVDRLPDILEVVAHVLPTSWAMDSVWHSIKGTTSMGVIFGKWGIALLLASIWFMITYFMCKTVERRIRIKATLGIN